MSTKNTPFGGGPLPPSVNYLNVARTMIVNGMISNDFELKEDFMPLTILFKPHFFHQSFLSSFF
jgi:hypothetical protein